MKFKIVYDKKGRIRVRFGTYAFNKYEAMGLKDYFLNLKCVLHTEIHPSNGSVLLNYTSGNRQMVLTHLESLTREKIKENAYPVNREFELLNFKTKQKLFFMFARKYMLKYFFAPSFMKMITVIRAVPFVLKGLKSLGNSRLNVDVLDATSISVSIATNHYSTANNVMFLLKVSSLLEQYTVKSAKLELAKSMSINIDFVWVKENETEIKKPISELKCEEIVVVRTGSVIPVDGEVVGGQAMVNEASMTGESAPSRKRFGSTCHAGTVVEDGELHIRVLALQNETRIHKILDMIDESQEYKAEIQKNAQKHADKLVPFSLLVFIGTYLFTGNIRKSTSVLMVDYSCAIKLFTPIAIISAMREAAERGIVVKSGSALEEFSKADTVVFDKTGTLTKAVPHLSKVIPLGGYTQREVLKIAACLEEHFPHSVARAIVHAAEEKGITHEEEHAELNYIVAHGISSTLKGKKVLIGSRHFIEDDEGVLFSDEVNTILEQQTELCSHLYLSLGAEIIGIFCISDPLRDEAKSVISVLRNLGIENVHMLTGDSKKSAEFMGKELGISQIEAQILPDEKFKIVQKLKSEGKRLIMVGDGINDSPALSAANVSVAMKDASDIAREVADVTLLSSDLRDLIYLKLLSKALIRRIEKAYGSIISFNSLLLFGGLIGVLSPDMAAIFHNMSTVGICGYATVPLMRQSERAMAEEFRNDQSDKL